MRKLIASRPPLAEVIPVELSRAANPAYCTCRHCCPDLSAVDRERVEAEFTAWTKARRAWAHDHGYDGMDLLIEMLP